jgi:hypothetical protein
MTDMADNARMVVAHELDLFAKTIDEHWRDQFFHPMNRDEWVRRFCEWLAEKQDKSAQVRASND